MVKKSILTNGPMIRLSMKVLMFTKFKRVLCFNYVVFNLIKGNIMVKKQQYNV